MSDENRLFSYILFQSRKKNVELFCIAQLRNTIDVRFRELCDLIIQCKRTHEGFEYILSDPQFINYCRTVLPYESAKKYFKYYDTNEIIIDNKPTAMFLTDNEKMEQVEKLSPRLKSDYYDEYKSINPQCKTVPKLKRSYVNIWCMNNNIDESLTKLLYDYIKSFE